LRAPPAGRPPCADDAAVIEVRWLVDTGRAKRIEVAARMVATAMSDQQSVTVTTRRLAGKARAASRLCLAAVIERNDFAVGAVLYSDLAALMIEYISG
jgi:hypothetical protein